VSFRGLVFRGLSVGLALLTWGCDHATKEAATTLAGGEAIKVMPGVELRYVENTDVAFSLLSRLGVPRSPVMLATMSAIALAALALMLLWKRASFATYAGIALVIGGGVGNLFDRITRKGVVDFIHVTGWPVFNVADIAVCVGVAIMALAHLFPRRRHPHHDAA
jgi:signal peptidase II